MEVKVIVLGMLLGSADTSELLFPNFIFIKHKNLNVSSLDTDEA